VEGGDIRADHIERFLVEGHTGPVDHFRGVDDDHRPFPGEDVTERSPVEDVFVVVFRREVAAVVIRGRELHPVHGVEKDAARELALDVLFQETGLEGHGTHGTRFSGTGLDGNAAAIGSGQGDRFQQWIAGDQFR
jgi:hypothetical protein